MNREKLFLEHIAYNLRVSSLVMTTVAGSGHPTSSLSAADIMAALFFDAMHFDPTNYDNPNNDRFILSKGHASPVFYAIFKELGIISEEQLYTYRRFDSVLEGHPTLRFKWTEAATGALGIGLSIGNGMALTAKMEERPYYTYVLLGDAEVAEGAIWEAAEVAAFYKLNNLIAIIDVNRLGQTGETQHGYHMQRYADKFHAFGWHTIIIDGHNMSEIVHAFEKARLVENKPTIIVAKTIKGFGVDIAENKNGFHGKAFKKEELNDILAKMEKRFEKAVKFDAKEFGWKPHLPPGPKDAKETHGCSSVLMPESKYKIGDEEKTRKVYGQALAKLGNTCKAIVSLDADVSNSTFAEIFKEAHPKRFIEAFVAEQNMVSMSVGMWKRGKVPFISTFGAFFSRAFDQIRMAAISTAPLRLVGSHAGVSIGQDGPSQMGLEDIALMRSLPGSIVFYPCDATSTWKLVPLMAQYTDGISYLRTTRMATPVLYSDQEEFVIGGCKVLRQSDTDKACVIGAGITVHEALKAYNELKKINISIAVIDLYCLKPLDVETIQKVAEASNKCVVTVEDHYRAGGIGEAITFALKNSGIRFANLAVKELPRSGMPYELLASAGIDAKSIVEKVKTLC